ncbi:spore coat U domain-containing protein [Brucella sp. TWI432]
MSTKLIAIGLSSIIATAAFMPSANAGSVSGKLSVRANITSSCVLSNGSNPVMDFGNLSDLNPTDTKQAVPADKGIKLTCNKDLPYSIGLNGGQHSAVPIGGLPRMANGDNYISYFLFQDDKYKLLWGHDHDKRLFATGNGQEQKYPIYGIIPKQKTPKYGLYTDEQVIDVEF